MNFPFLHRHTHARTHVFGNVTEHTRALTTIQPFASPVSAVCAYPPKCTYVNEPDVHAAERTAFARTRYVFIPRRGPNGIDCAVDCCSPKDGTVRATRRNVCVIRDIPCWTFFVNGARRGQWVKGPSPLLEIFQNHCRFNATLTDRNHDWDPFTKSGKRFYTFRRSET